MVVLLTRPLEDSRRIAGLLEADGIETAIWALTRIVPLMQELKVPPVVDGLALTSANGARAFAALSPRRDLAVLAVGDRTAEVARALGFAAVFSAGGTAEDLARLASMAGVRHLFHPRGRDTAVDLGALLRDVGVRLTEAVVYAAEQGGPPPAPVAAGLASGAIGLVTLWSRRNAEIFAERVRGGLTIAPGLSGLAISERSAAPLDGLGLACVAIAERPDGRAMLASIRLLAGSGGR